MQRVLAGLPFGMPGIGLDIDGAIQQAPQSLRQSISATPVGWGKKRDNSSRVRWPPAESLPLAIFTLIVLRHRFHLWRINAQHTLF